MLGYAQATPAASVRGSTLTGKMPVCREADARTRTGDPFITREQAQGHPGLPRVINAHPTGPHGAPHSPGYPPMARAGLRQDYASAAPTAGLDGPSRTIIYDPAEEPTEPQPREEPTPEPEREPAPQPEREPVPA